MAKKMMELLFGFVKDFYTMMIELTSCEWLQMIEIIAFGMIVATALAVAVYWISVKDNKKTSHKTH